MQSALFAPWLQLYSRWSHWTKQGSHSGLVCFLFLIGCLLSVKFCNWVDPNIFNLTVRSFVSFHGLNLNFLKSFFSFSCWLSPFVSFRGCHWTPSSWFIWCIRFKSRASLFNRQNRLTFDYTCCHPFQIMWLYTWEITVVRYFTHRWLHRSIQKWN